MFDHDAYHDPDNLLNTAMQFTGIRDTLNPSTHS